MLTRLYGTRGDKEILKMHFKGDYHYEKDC